MASNLFTHASYEDILLSAKDAGYSFGQFDLLPPPEDPRPWCLLRHDCDNDLSAALDMAILEHRNNISSTWFLMLRSPMYNIFSQSFAAAVNEILSLNHHIGLHFDESGILDGDILQNVNLERKILSREFKVPINTVSFHQPSRRILDGAVKLECVNTYSAEDLPGFYYYSDSNMVLREGCPSQLFQRIAFERLQLLIHPEWWTPQECSIEEKWVRMVQNNVDIIESTLHKREGAYPGSMRLGVHRMPK